MNPSASPHFLKFPLIFLSFGSQRLKKIKSKTSKINQSRKANQPAARGDMEQATAGRPALGSVSPRSVARRMRIFSPFRPTHRLFCSARILLGSCYAVFNLATDLYGHLCATRCSRCGFCFRRLDTGLSEGFGLGFPSL